MSLILRVALEEWRHWARSRLAWLGTLVFLALLSSVAALTAVRVESERQQRQKAQAAAHQQFLAQPARHPHRMIHYGHYVFRPPPPLAIVDPGVSAIAGNAIFLEGHRQNTAAFATAQASARAGGLGLATTAVMYQVLVPLLLIAIGHGVVLRERETQTLGTLLAQGLSPTGLVLGKGLALLGLVGLVTAPLLVAAAGSVSLGEHRAAAAALVGSYLLYLALWAVAVLAASVWVRERRFALALLLGAWLAATLLVPRFAAVVTRARLPSVGKTHDDLLMRQELERSGDGHNPKDPAFAKLKSNLLEKYGAERVEDLPVNLRGVVAEKAEASLTQVLRRHAEARMAREQEQAQHIERFGWLSPAVAVGVASRAVANTDIRTHHRFLREAEALRLEFVQSLNRLHATELSYADDVKRSRDVAAERRTRVAANHWALLPAFRFTPASAQERLSLASASWLQLLAWVGALAAAVMAGARRLAP